MPANVAKSMEQSVAKKMMGGENENDAGDTAEDASEYPGIEVEIKMCASSWDELRKRLPLLFK